MEIVWLLMVGFWSLRIVGNLLTYVHLWWVKEYRFDRMLIHLRTAQGKRIFFPFWKRPPLSPKTITVTLLSGVVLLGFFSLLPLSLFLRFITIDIATFPLTWIVVGLLKLPTLVYHEVLITIAVRKLRAHKPMMVVGITGSYGKTSTKDYLTSILSNRFRVLKTEASKNSPIGIAETVIRQLRSDHEIFVVEMGAYKRGEIARMAKMVRPQIGIITAINPQHQDLFGSLETTMRAKYELVQGLVGQGTAIFNADDKRTCQMAEWAKRDGREVWWWSREETKASFGERFFAARDIKADFSGVEFTCVAGKEKVKVSAKVPGEHQVSNILAAMAAAVALGMKLREAAAAAWQIKSAAKVMELVKGVNGSMFINDTFNNNPAAAKAALSFLSKNKGRKILVFQPMIELGSFTESSHEEVGEHAARVCDGIILTNTNFQEAFTCGVRKVSKNTPVMVLAPTQAAAYIQARAGKGDIVLFKGKEAEHVLIRLTGKKN